MAVMTEGLTGAMSVGLDDGCRVAAMLVLPGLTPWENADLRVRFVLRTHVDTTINTTTVL